MLTKNENLLNVIARDLATSSLNETYLIAGDGFEINRASTDVRRAIEVAQSLVGAASAADALATHYSLATEIRSSTPTFSDGCSGFVTVGHAVVQFAVRKIGASPVTYRMLFTRLDTGALAKNMKDRMDALEDRVLKLEQSAS